MKSTIQSISASLRITLATLLVCVAGYTLATLGLAQGATPDTANGSLITRDGAVVGSRLIAQRFDRPEYFWARPSAPDYNASGAAGSNESPTSPDVVARAVDVVARYGATPENPLPPELAAASGGGLDPHVTVHAARYQAPRVAEARGIPRAEVEALIERHAFSPGGLLTPEQLVDVLELNLALDEQHPTAASSRRSATSPHVVIR